jgi:hypothetical protein
MEKKPFNLDDFLYKPDTFGTIRAMGIDKYPGEMPIVRELLQNADDAGGATTVRFWIDENEIVVENDGKPFTKPGEVERKEDSDFFRISHIGLGKTDETMTGTFGIGFTSIFHITDSPRIVSNGWDFEIHVDDVPSIKPVPFNRITKLHLPLRLKETEFSKKIKAESFDLRKLQSFEKEIIHEAYRDIFHLKTIKKIEAYKNKARLFSISKKIKIEYIQKVISREQITIRIAYKVNGRKKEHIEEWTTYSLNELDIPPHLFDLGQTLKQKVAITIPLNHKSNGITKGFDPENYAYHTLPVMLTDFNFKYNASKLYTTSGRSEFVTKERSKLRWNLWQMDNLAELLVHIVEELVANKTDPKILYQIIPTLTQPLHTLDEQIFNSFKAKVESNQISMFYTSDGIWRQKVGTFINWDGLEKVLPEDSGYHIVHPNLRQFASIFKSYGIGVLDIEEFVNYLRRRYGISPFNSNIREDPTIIAKIYEYFGKKNKIESRLIEQLKTICILLTEEGTLRSHEYGVYFPTDEKMPLIDNDDILNSLTYRSLAAKKFLEKKLKIKRIDLHYLISDSFLRRIRSYNDDQKFEFVWYLINRQRYVFRKRNTVDELKTNLREILIVEKGDDPSGPIFFADSELKQIFENKLNYLSPRYEEQGKKEKSKWRYFLKKIGVEDCPHPERILTVLKIIESTGFNEKNTKKADALLRFLEAHWKGFYLKYLENLTILKEFRWIPTDNNTLEYPENVYANRNVLKLIGPSHDIIYIKPPKNKRILKILGLLIEARLDDVIEFILARATEKGNRKTSIPFMVYSFIDRKAEALTPEQIEVMRQNRTIMIDGKMWKPGAVFLEDCRNDFGPNGWLRAYALNTKFSKLQRLCYRLNISRTARSPDDYIEWLVDLAETSEDYIVDEWKASLIYNAYSKLAMIVNSISDEQLEKLRHKKIILTSNSLLRLPSECYLLRRGEEVVNERLEKSGIDIPIIRAENAEHEKFYQCLGVNEIAYSLCGKRVDTNETKIDQKLTDRFTAMIPWLDGFEFSSTGTVSEHNLIFAKMKVYRVNRLKVQYTILSEENERQGTPIEDLCCFERNEENILFLDENFSLEKNEHIHLLSLNLTRDLNPSINKIGWNLAIASLLVLGKIIGVSPYEREVKRPLEFIEGTALEPEAILGVERKVPERLLTQTIEPVMSEFQKLPLPTSTYSPQESREVSVPEVSYDINKEDLEKEVEDMKQLLTEGKIPSTGISEVWREPVEIDKVTGKARVVVRSFVSASSRKNWELRTLNGEKVYVETEMDPVKMDVVISSIKPFKEYMKKIIEIMGGNPDTVNVCIANPVTDGDRREGQLFFNVLRNDKQLRWIVVAARELAYIQFPKPSQAHISLMTDLIEKALERIQEIYPEIFKEKK